MKPRVFGKKPIRVHSPRGRCGRHFLNYSGYFCLTLHMLPAGGGAGEAGAGEPDRDPGGRPQRGQLGHQPIGGDPARGGPLPAPAGDSGGVVRARQDPHLRLQPGPVRQPLPRPHQGALTAWPPVTALRQSPMFHLYRGCPLHPLYEW